MTPIDHVKPPIASFIMATMPVHEIDCTHNILQMTNLKDLRFYKC